MQAGILHIASKSKELHSAARDAHWLCREIGKPRQADLFNLMKLSRINCKLFREIGKPRQGAVFNLIKLSRITFKHAIRKCKKDKENIIADSIAQNMCKKYRRKFCKEIKHYTNSKVKLPTNIKGVHGDGTLGQCGSTTLKILLTVRKTAVVIKFTLVALLRKLE